MYQSTDDVDDTGANKNTSTTTTTTTTTGNNAHHSGSPIPIEGIETTSDSPSHNQSSSRHERGLRRRSPLIQIDSPTFQSDNNRRTGSPQVYSPIINDPDIPKRSISSPTHSGNLQQTRNRSRSRSRSRSRRRNLNRSRSRTDRISPSPPTTSTQEDPKGNSSFFSSVSVLIKILVFLFLL